MLTILTTYMDGLTALLRQAAQAERAAHAQPIAFPTIRHQCPHCRKTWAKPSSAAAHIARCWHNPQARGCKTCIHFIPPEPGWDEECAQALDVTSLRIDCPLWTTA